MQHDICLCWRHQRSLQAGSGTLNQSKDISILTESFINQDQIHRRSTIIGWAWYDSTRKEHVRGHFFERLQNAIENKNKSNENKIILGGFNSSMNKMNRDDGNVTQRIYR